MIYLVFGWFMGFQGPLSLAGGQASGFGYENFQKAHGLWQKAAAAHGLTNSKQKAKGWLSYQQEVVVAIEGHYQMPWMLREVELKIQSHHQLSGQALHKVSEWQRGETLQREEVVFVRERARVGNLDNPTSDWVGQGNDDFEDSQNEAHFGDPLVVLTRMGERLATLQFLGAAATETDQGSKTMNVLSYVDHDGTLVRVYLDSESNLLQHLEIAHHHRGFGDQFENLVFSDYRKVGAFMLPFLRQERRYKDDVGTLTTARRTQAEYQEEAPLRQLTDLLKNSTPNAPKATWLDLGESVYAVTFEGEEGRNFVVGFDQFSLIITATYSSESSERLLQLVREKLPQQPVKFAALSHFHPHYSWGLRPFFAAGIPVITTPSTKEYLEKLASNPHRFKPDALEHQPAMPKIQNVTGKRTLADDHQRLEIFDIGEASNHTPEYLVFYFPRLKLLVQGDLIWYRRDGTTYRGGPRAKGLYDFILDQNLDVELIATAGDYKDYQSWIPMGLLADLANGENTVLKNLAQQEN